MNVRASISGVWLLVLLSLVSCGESEKEKQARLEQERLQAEALRVQKLESELKDLLTKDFIDPASAQFRGVKIGKHEMHGEGICGEVNAKNRLGGYVGFRWFYVATKTPRYPQPSLDKPALEVCQDDKLYICSTVLERYGCITKEQYDAIQAKYLDTVKDFWSNLGKR